MKKAKNKIIKKEVPMRRNVILLDGRERIISNKNKQSIDTLYSGVFTFNMGYLDPDITLHNVIFDNICNRLSTHSLSYCLQITTAFGHLFKQINFQNSSKLNLEHLVLIHNTPNSYVAMIFPVLRSISQEAPSVLSKNLVSYLRNSQKWEQKGKGAYFGLVTNDPQRGTFTDQELDNLQATLNENYNIEKVSLEEFTLAWMFIATGLRPIQVAKMMIKDIQISNGPEGKEIILNTPLAKGERTVTNEYWLRKSPSVLTDCLLHYLNSPSMIKRNSLDQLFIGSSGTLSGKLTKIFKNLPTWSERLQDKIPVFPYRFRYTLATRALRHGGSDWEVARLLTHRSTTCIKYYRASMPELQIPIKEAIGSEMEFFARAFQGKLIQDSNEATYDDGNALIRDFLHLTGEKVGACGTKSKCYQYAPISCLTCNHFEPFKNAPWEEFLTELLKDQEKEKELRIRQINENSISAIREIIMLSQKRETV